MLDKELYKSKLSAVTDAEGKAVETDDFVDIVKFTARNRNYEVAVQTNAYSLQDVLAYQRKTRELEEAKKQNEAHMRLSRIIQKCHDEKMIADLNEVLELLPETAGSNEEAEFKVNSEFLLKGALVWNVADIELNEQGLMTGDFRVVQEASAAIMGALSPNSEGATPANAPS